MLFEHVLASVRVMRRRLGGLGVLAVLEACYLRRHLRVLFECVLKSVRAIRRRLGGLGSLLSAKVSWRVL